MADMTKRPPEGGIRWSSSDIGSWKRWGRDGVRARPATAGRASYSQPPELPPAYPPHEVMMYGLRPPPSTAGCEYSVKYLGVLHGDVGILSQRRPLTATIRGVGNGAGNQAPPGLMPTDRPDRSTQGAFRLSADVYARIPSPENLDETPRPELWDEWKVVNFMPDRGNRGFHSNRPGSAAARLMQREAQFFKAGGVMFGPVPGQRPLDGPSDPMRRRPDSAILSAVVAPLVMAPRARTSRDGRRRRRRKPTRRVQSAGALRSRRSRVPSAARSGRVTGVDSGRYGDGDDGGDGDGDGDGGDGDGAGASPGRPPALEPVGAPVKPVLLWQSHHQKRTPRGTASIDGDVASSLYSAPSLRNLSRPASPTGAVVAGSSGGEASHSRAPSAASAPPGTPPATSSPSLPTDIAAAAAQAHVVTRGGGSMSPSPLPSPLPSPSPLVSRHGSGSVRDGDASPAAGLGPHPTLSTASAAEDGSPDSKAVLASPPARHRRSAPGGTGPAAMAARHGSVTALRHDGTDLVVDERRHGSHLRAPDGLPDLSQPSPVVHPSVSIRLDRMRHRFLHTAVARGQKAAGFGVRARSRRTSQSGGASASASSSTSAAAAPYGGRRALHTAVPPVAVGVQESQGSFGAWGSSVTSDGTRGGGSAVLPATPRGATARVLHGPRASPVRSTLVSRGRLR